MTHTTLRTFSLALALFIASCSPGSSRPGDEADAATIERGKQTFRYDTFGNETQWSYKLRMHEVSRSAVDPKK